MKNRTLAETIFDLSVAIENCERSGNHEWRATHRESLAACLAMLPSGSGIDSGTTLVGVITGRVARRNGTRERIVFACEFHHMDTHGGYDGWTRHKITVRPSFTGLDIEISGNNRNDIKEYLHDVYYDSLTQIVKYDTINKRWNVEHAA